MLLAFVITLFSCILSFCIAISIDWPYTEWYECGLAIISYILMLTILCMLVAIPANKWSNSDFIQEVEATRITVEQQREKLDLTEYERATMTNDIIEVNRLIAQHKNAYKPWRAKYWTDKRIMDLELIR